jgi:hypothetical protein
MGTNYFVRLPGIDTEDPRAHFGKRSSIGHGKCCFTWAIDPISLIALLTVGHGVPVNIMDDESIEDSYGARFSIFSFVNLIRDDEQRFDSIGRVFS